MLDRKKFLRLTGLCGVVAPVAAFSCISLAISLSPWFSWSANALSNLGVGEAAWLFNSGLMVGGIFAVIFAVGLWATFRKQALRRLGGILVFFGAVALFGVGLFPESTGAIHLYFSFAFFTLMALALLVLGAGTVRAGSKGFGVFTLLMGIAAIIPWASPWDGVAIPETIAGLAVGAWCVAQGRRLYLRKEVSAQLYRSSQGFPIRTR